MDFSPELGGFQTTWLLMPLYFKVGTYCIGIQDDRVEVSIGISICSGTCILQGIESEHTLKLLKVEYNKHESEHIFARI